MASSQAKYWQFLSRKTTEHEIRFPAENVFNSVVVQGRVVSKPFRIDFADVVGRNPSIGAHQYTDEYLDNFADSRWPFCLEGTIEFSTKDGVTPPTTTELLQDFRSLVFDACRTVPMFADQFSKKPGYRRSYGAPKSGDIFGQRRPNPSNYLHPAQPGEFIGPGLIELDGYDGVWSQIIPLPGATSLENDRDHLGNVIQRMRLHYNSYNELRDAENYLLGDNAAAIKGAVRSAAAGVEANLKFFCVQHDIVYPTAGLPFDDKIENILTDAQMPSYRAVSSSDSEQLLYLYRARNSQHEGDYFYKNNSGQQVQVDKQQAQQFVDSAKKFVLWLDALA